MYDLVRVQVLHAERDLLRPGDELLGRYDPATVLQLLVQRTVRTVLHDDAEHWRLGADPSVGLVQWWSGEIRRIVACSASGRLSRSGCEDVAWGRHGENNPLRLHLLLLLFLLLAQACRHALRGQVRARAHIRLTNVHRFGLRFRVHKLNVARFGLALDAPIPARAALWAAVDRARADPPVAELFHPAGGGRRWSHRLDGDSFRAGDG